jgi:hypothetical protein
LARYCGRVRQSGILALFAAKDIERNTPRSSVAFFKVVFGFLESFNRLKHGLRVFARDFHFIDL